MQVGSKTENPQDPLDPVAQSHPARTLTAIDSVGVVRGVHGDFFMPRNDLIMKQTRTFGAHTRPEIALVRSFVNPGDVIVDVGAHVGTFTIPLAGSTGFEGRVLAFEPFAESRDLLEFNVVLNGLERIIDVIPYALSAAESRYFVVPNQTANSGASHLRPDEPEPDPPRRRSTDPPNVDGPEDDAGPDECDGSGVAVTVDAMSLDGYLAEYEPGLEDLSLIKIDVEGMEEAVLLGAAKALETFRPILYFEVAAGHAARFGLRGASHIDALVGLEYRFFRNDGPRNAADDDFTLRPVAPAMAQEMVAADVVADLLALPKGLVPEESR